MTFNELIETIRLPFRKDRELYRSFYAILGFYPHDIQPYKQALIHRSLSAKDKDGSPQNNERLEYLGDAILDAVVGDIVFRHFKNQHEGFLTNARSRIVQRETLGKLAVSIGLSKLLQSNDRCLSHNSYLAGNAFEALIGAIYLDKGYDACMRFMQERILGKHIDLDKIAKDNPNFKSKLLEWAQKKRFDVEFRLLHEDRDDEGNALFRTQVFINGLPLGKGNGYSKREGHQRAAKRTITMLKSDHDLMQQLFDKKKEEIISDTQSYNEPNESYPSCVLGTATEA